jgi:hypothetical protein
LHLSCAARVIAMDIKGANRKQLIEAIIKKLGKDKAHFFITTNLKTSTIKRKTWTQCRCNKKKKKGGPQV